MINKYLTSLAIFLGLLSQSSFSKTNFLLKAGYPYFVVGENQATSTIDYLGVAIGATIEARLSENSYLDLSIDTSYFPKRESFTLERRDKKTVGDTSLLTSFYSINYSKIIHQSMNYNYVVGGGPTLGIYTLNFEDFDENDSSISAVNRLRVQNVGIRLSSRLENLNNKSFFEFIFIYSKRNSFSLIDDATNDAERIASYKLYKDSPVWSMILYCGKYLF